MGKYMRKGKGVGEVAVMEVSSQGSLGVRTRARTLASQRDHRRLATPSSKSVTSAKQHHHNNASSPPCFASSMHTSYLELRSRKLEKIISRCHHRDEEATTTGNESNSSLGEASRLALSEGVGEAKPSVEVASDKSSRRVQQQSSVAHSRNNSGTFSHAHSNAKPVKTRRKEQRQHNPPAQPSQLPDVEIQDNDAMEVEASFGENVMDFDSRERRTTRETTPSSHMRDMETPGSTTRPAPPTSGRRRLLQNEAHSQQFHVPTTNEIEEFFSGAEQQEQRRFTERYNYDPVSDSPLPGRFEWVSFRS